MLENAFDGGAVGDRREEDHFAAYSQVVKAMAGRPVVIRTLDLGADKMLTETTPEEERNPCLGLRSIRLSLRQLPMFRTQLRAILRASALGDVRVMCLMKQRIEKIWQTGIRELNLNRQLSPSDGRSGDR